MDEVIPTRKIDSERLASYLKSLVERTENYPLEKLNSIWFDLFDLIESCRLLPTEELIFEVFPSLSPLKNPLILSFFFSETRKQSSLNSLIILFFFHS